ncbi:hypothetical protein ETU10_07300 [Apibacter muscae]|uniref:ATP-dependent Clp protease proteolytic subunit n=1 Tax=Apibacter muscae TaxID=2509004 RepID=UPI0011AD8B27|nr:ATP-dependent Clp protease proteolytic subunit [Apibacter muscae]TWP23522.1 hypothetical protein ETU10_07300 [Apibacter muscae]
MKSTLQITASVEKSIGQIRITDRISEYSDTSSSSVVRKIVEDLIKQGVKKAEVYINSQGGSTFEETEIENALDQLEEVNLTVGALAASAATKLVAKYPTSAFSNSQFMIHKPMLGTYGNVTQIQADLKLLINTTADYKKAYASKMKKTEEEIEALWKDGDYWMTAQEALALGLIDRIIEEPEKVTAESLAILEACGAPHIPHLIKEKPNKTTMDRKQLIASLGLATDATDAEIAEKIADNRQKAEQAEQTKAQAEALKKTNAEALVNQAILDKKITAEQKATYQILAEADFNATQAVISSLPTPQALSSQLNPQQQQKINAARASWTLDDYIEKDPKALAEMEVKDPQNFLRLNQEYYGS